MLGKIEGKRRRRATEGKTVGWYHRLNGHEFEQTRGDSQGQGSLACCSCLGLQRVTHDLATGQQQRPDTSIMEWLNRPSTFILRNITQS